MSGDIYDEAEDVLVFSTGRKTDRLWSSIGIGADLEIYHGFDGTLSEVCTMSADEIVEVADWAIKRWTELRDQTQAGINQRIREERSK